MLLLVGAIKGLTFKFNRHKHLFYSIYNSRRDFCRYYQKGYTTNPQYLETFKNKFLVIESYGRAIVTDPGLAKEKVLGVANPTDLDKKAAVKAAKTKYLGVTMICGSDQVRYGKMVEELQNDFTKGNNDYPTNTT